MRPADKTQNLVSLNFILRIQAYNVGGRNAFVHCAQHFGRASVNLVIKEQARRIWIFKRTAVKIRPGHQYDLDRAIGNRVNSIA